MAPLRPRPASPGDAEFLAALHARCFDAATEEVWDQPAIAALMNTPGVFAFVSVDDGGHPAGLVIARVGAGESEILTIGVLPDGRRRGQGAALLDAARRRAARHGAEALYLEVAADNGPALALYRRGGFRQVGRRTGYYRRTTGPVDAILLRREIGPATEPRSAHPAVGR